jgi:hypothetical protein
MVQNRKLIGTLVSVLSLGSDATTKLKELLTAHPDEGTWGRPYNNWFEKSRGGFTSELTAMFKSSSPGAADKLRKVQNDKRFILNSKSFNKSTFNVVTWTCIEVLKFISWETNAPLPAAVANAMVYPPASQPPMGILPAQETTPAPP